jgi:hypothetical protein
MFDADGPTASRTKFAPGFNEEIGVVSELEELSHLIDAALAMPLST